MRTDTVQLDREVDRFRRGVPTIESGNAKNEMIVNVFERVYLRSVERERAQNKE